MVVAILHVALDSLNVLATAGGFVAFFFHLNLSFRMIRNAASACSADFGSFASPIYSLPRDLEGHTVK